MKAASVRAFLRGLLRWSCLKQQRSRRGLFGSEGLLYKFVDHVHNAARIHRSPESVIDVLHSHARGGGAKSSIQSCEALVGGTIACAGGHCNDWCPHESRNDRYQGSISPAYHDDDLARPKSCAHSPLLSIPTRPNRRATVPDGGDTSSTNFMSTATPFLGTLYFRSCPYQK